ncbi:MAG: IS1 family transposase, partial [Chloroflexi bacterium]|nr:IS1 family transposase [Chloroflexota bacterium]
FEVGERSEETFLRLYERLLDAKRYGSDDYNVYKNVYKWLPRDRYKIGKGSEVNGNDRLHSVLRGKLNRLARKTRGYSKSVEMLLDSVALVCLRL